MPLENGTPQVAIVRPVLLHRNRPEKANEIKSTEMNENQKDEKEDRKDSPSASPAHRLSLNQLHLKF